MLRPKELAVPDGHEDVVFSTFKSVRPSTHKSIVLAALAALALAALLHA